MNFLGLSIQLANPYSYEVRIAIDGIDLIDRVQEFESRSDEPMLAAIYAPIWFSASRLPGLLGGPRRWKIAGRFFGRVDEPFRRSGLVRLLACGACGMDECWPLLARVRVGERTVTWHEFRQRNPESGYEGFGPFVFDRVAYEAEVVQAFGSVRLGPVDPVQRQVLRERLARSEKG